MYRLPVTDNVLVWSQSGIPASVLAVALKVYELDHPGTPLRKLLTAKDIKHVRQTLRLTLGGTGLQPV